MKTIFFLLVLSFVAVVLSTNSSSIAFKNDEFAAKNNSRTQIELFYSITQQAQDHFQLKWSQYHHIDYHKVIVSNASLNILIEQNLNSICKPGNCVADLNTAGQLTPFTRYNFKLLFCANKYVCNLINIVENVLTWPSAPSSISFLSIKEISAYRYRVDFVAPENPNGPLDYYHVIQNGNYKHRFTANVTSAEVDLYCNLFNLYIRIAVTASNTLPNGQELFGIESDDILVKFCTWSLVFYIGISLGSLIIFVAVGITVFLLYNKSKQIFENLNIKVESDKMKNYSLKREIEQQNENDLNNNLTEGEIQYISSNRNQTNQISSSYVTMEEIAQHPNNSNNPKDLPNTSLNDITQIKQFSSSYVPLDQIN